MADRPNVGGNRLEVALWQDHSSHRWHRARMLLGLRHAVRYRLRDALKASVAPQPFAAGEIGPDRRADGVSGVLFPGGVESPTFPRVRLACPSLCPAIFAISVRAGRVLGAGLWSPFFNFHFGGQRPVRLQTETGSQSALG